MDVQTSKPEDLFRSLEDASSIDLDWFGEVGSTQPIM